MSGAPDPYGRFLRTGAGKTVAKKLGLPQPAQLLRRGDRPDVPADPVVVLGASAGADALAAWLLDRGADVRRRFEGLRTVGAALVVLDEIARPSDIGEILLPLAEAMRSLAPGARVITVSRSPQTADADASAAARGGVEGIVRSLGHEMRRGGTANGVLVDDGVPLDAPGVLGALAFLLSPRSAYVDGQLLRVASAAGGPLEQARPLAGRTAVVTGAARGIGAAIARTLATDGARLVLLDVPAAGTDLARLANELSASTASGPAHALQLDITAPDAGERILAFFRTKGLTLDILVHNAGITRDRMFANVSADRWDSVIGVNIEAQIAIDAALVDAEHRGEGILGDAPRVVSLASTSGIAGNRGQTNYAASKAGVVARVGMLARELEEFGGTANAIAPGFIETDMTARMPAVAREVARRVSSLQQGGRPEDVAEAVAFLASGPAGGLRGETLRVCGQNIVGK